MDFVRRLGTHVKRLAPIRPRRSLSGRHNRLIVSMVDAGHSYGAIRRELGVGNSEIDVALREQSDSDRPFPLLP